MPGFLALVLAIFFSGCSPRLTDDAVLLVPESDVDIAQAGVDQFADHIGVKVTVTDDPKVWHSWSTSERWKALDADKGFKVRGYLELCPKGTGALATTDRDAKRIWLGHCLKGASDRYVAIAHEIGHMVGAEHCVEGLMRTEDVHSIDVSRITHAELRALYDL